MAGLTRYLLHLLIALDQLGTTALGGWPDETMSSYAYRLHLQGKPAGFMRRVIDRLFFWQPDHCRWAYESERQRAQQPPELRA